MTTNFAQQTSGSIFDHIEHPLESGNCAEIRIGYLIVRMRSGEFLCAFYLRVVE